MPPLRNFGFYSSQAECSLKSVSASKFCNVQDLQNHLRPDLFEDGLRISLEFEDKLFNPNQLPTLFALDEIAVNIKAFCSGRIFIYLYSIFLE